MSTGRKPTPQGAGGPSECAGQSGKSCKDNIEVVEVMEISSPIPSKPYRFSRSQPAARAMKPPEWTRGASAAVIWRDISLRAETASRGP